MINFKRTDHIHICVPAERLEEARLFYTDVIGLRQIERAVELTDEGLWFQAGDIELHIGVEAHRFDTMRHTAFEVTDLDAARKHLEKHGVKFKEQRKIANRNRFAFIDPFGNQMELLEYHS
ncbi:VOC family protein [Mucilaginibacter sp. KACC 22063]|uniref:VOC family protein n=1 Tax=Mucilaginibacter sp. KACC 22063 TaxID=3025666 RepID=UPI002366A5CB|nr:VOC family protein [Mucilaginibacter sp. KACC 22063]WDF56000.1 VOC family protein [Mucilaginibacter sp. KACC 22063]